MSESTPGPWEVFDRGFGLPGNGRRTIAVMKDGKQVVGWMGFDTSDFQKDASANARLIASAPDLAADNERLRKALERLIESFAGLHVEYARQHSASIDGAVVDEDDERRVFEQWPEVKAARAALAGKDET